MCVLVRVCMYVCLQVGMGIPLHCIKDIRSLYKKEIWETTPIDFDKLATPLTPPP